MRLLYFVVIQSLGYSRWLWAEVAHFKLACFGNLAFLLTFKGNQSRNVKWQWSPGTHLDINKHDNPVIGHVQNKERESNTKICFIYICLMKSDNI